MSNFELIFPILCCIDCMAIGGCLVNYFENTIKQIEEESREGKENREKSSEESSKEVYKIRYGASDDSICMAWQSNLEYVQKNRPEETEDYQHNQRLAIKAVSEARLKLDVLGLIHVN